MLIQVHLTDTEVRVIFNRMGYKTEWGTKTVFNSTYHNKLKESEIETLYVIVDGMKIEAKEAIETVFRERIFELLMINNDQNDNN